VIVTILALVGTLLVLAGPVSARAVKVEFQGTWIPMAIIEGEREILPSGRVRIRDQAWIVKDEVPGCPLATGRTSYNMQFNGDQDGTGPIWGDICTEVGTWSTQTEDGPDCYLLGEEYWCFEKGEGVWEGKYTGYAVDWGVTYAETRDVAHGSEGLDGQKIFRDRIHPQILATQPTNLSGYILDPHGE
jgi:hypothetical protein